MEYPQEGKRGATPCTRIEVRRSSCILNGILNQDPSYQGITFVDMHRQRKRFSDDEGSLCASTLLVEFDNTGGIIGATPMLK